MQLKATFNLLLALAMVVCADPAPADILTPEGQDAEYLFRFFADADGVQVVSHSATYDVELENDARLGFHFNHEEVTIPAIDAPPGSDDAVDAITTASRPISGTGDAFDDFTKLRNEMQALLDYGNVGVGYYLSKEFDYFAQQLKTTFTDDFLDQNFYVSLGGSYGWDAIDPTEDVDSDTPSDSRKTLHGNVVLTQVLSPTAQIRVGFEVNRVRGLQHSPYRNVYADGGGVAEEHPDKRLRRDAFVRLNKYWRNRSSLKLSYRIYADDWGVKSHAIGARLSQYVGSAVGVRYRYRYYDQTAADFYRPEYDSADGVDGYLSGDYRLGAMKSHLFGTRLSIGLGSLSEDTVWLSQLGIHVNYERYFNDSNFSANVFETGLHYEF